MVVPVKAYYYTLSLKACAHLSPPQRGPFAPLLDEESPCAPLSLTKTRLLLLSSQLLLFLMSLSPLSPPHTTVDSIMAIALLQLLHICHIASCPFLLPLPSGSQCHCGNHTVATTMLSPLSLWCGVPKAEESRILHINWKLTLNNSGSVRHFNTSGSFVQCTTNTHIQRAASLFNTNKDTTKAWATGPSTPSFYQLH